MKRQVNLNEISDGGLYGSNDLVEVTCNGCKGKASCCHGMGSSIILDPYDIYRLTSNLNLTFEGLLTDRLELNLVDGIILPNLKMKGAQEQCSFLNEEGKCSIHGSRPGICRIFPLGRIYENHSFQYFLQVNECVNTSRTKVKVSNWIDTKDLEKNEKFLVDWHYFLNAAEEAVKGAGDEKTVKNINMFLLNLFYLMKYEPDRDFYLQFYERLQKGKELLGLR
ncbi:YkgJ family cysteine cluster protein [Anaerocolumna jejuensis]|uniref:YkgJ family cysteine cluster protein n=1 Tax=Anaerocolumna jejuensis TaxID=259063 RepID=UPI003F7C9E59